MITNESDIPFYLFGTGKKKLVHRSGTVNGMHVLKYSKRAFYEQAWKQHPILEEIRGLVIDDSTGDVVSRPFDKVYNYTENGAGVGEENTKVIAAQKINGFLGVVSCYNGKLVFSTSGTLDSEYADMWKHMFDEYVGITNWYSLVREYSHLTHMFEVVHPDDPHVVDEEPGVYLIGCREVSSGWNYSELMLDASAKIFNDIEPFSPKKVRRPKIFRDETLAYWIEEAKTDKTEGWMIRDAGTHETICKLKTRHYLEKKFLMRVKNDTRLAHWMEQNKDESFDEEIEMMIHRIRDIGVEQFVALKDQERIENEL